MNSLLDFAKTCNGACGDLNKDEPQISIVSPKNPTVSNNLAYRDNWKIISVSGIDTMADVELSTTNSTVSDGVRISGSRAKEGEIEIQILICPCSHCDKHNILDARRDLYRLVKCGTCGKCELCVDGKLNFTKLNVFDKRYCELRINCCGVERAVNVVYQSTTITRLDNDCELYTIKYLKPNATLHYPPMRTTDVVRLESDDLTFPKFICGKFSWDSLWSFKKCLTIPYQGNVTGYPRIWIIGDVLNPIITNTTTGQRIDFNRRQELFRLSGCHGTLLTLWPGRREFVSNGRSIYQDMNTGCSTFRLEKNCDEGMEICVEGLQVNPQTFGIRVDWFDLFDGFYRTEAEAEGLVNDILC